MTDLIVILWLSALIALLVAQAAFSVTLIREIRALKRYIVWIENGGADHG